jgi:hypothetical protein
MKDMAFYPHDGDVTSYTTAISVVVTLPFPHSPGEHDRKALDLAGYCRSRGVQVPLNGGVIHCAHAAGSSSAKGPGKKLHRMILSEEGALYNGYSSK